MSPLVSRDRFVTRNLRQLQIHYKDYIPVVVHPLILFVESDRSKAETISFAGLIRTNVTKTLDSRSRERLHCFSGGICHHRHSQEKGLRLQAWTATNKRLDSGFGVNDQPRKLSFFETSCLYTWPFNGGERRRRKTLGEKPRSKDRNDETTLKRGWVGNEGRLRR